MCIRDRSDLTGCLTNCSSRGLCKLDLVTQMYACACITYFSGSACKIDSRPCSQYPCLNNGTCTDSVTTSNGSTFTCECEANYYGTYCEHEIDVCHNKTCSGNGYCIKEQDVATCKCFTSYSGLNCEIESSVVKLVKNVQYTSIVICFTFIGSFIAIIILNDVWDYYIHNSKMAASKMHVKKSSGVIRFKYVHHSPAID